MFSSTSANTFGELSNIWMKKIPTLFSSYRELSEEDRKTITKMLKLFVRSYLSNLTENGTEKFSKKFSKKD